MTQYDRKDETKHDGDAEASAGYIITKLDNGIYDVHVGLELIMRGRAGTGYGTAALEVNTADGQSHIFGQVSLTAGSDFGDGYNRKYTKQEFRSNVQFENMDKVLTWGLILGVSSSEGFPTSINDLKKLLKENAEWLGKLTSTAIGSSFTSGKISYFRTTIR